MQFARANFLWIGMAIMPLLFLFLWWSGRVRQRLMASFIQSRLLSSLTVGLSPARRTLRLWLVGLSIALIFLALARPQWGFGYREVQQRGLDIVIAMDTSRSMLAEDAQPNRLARAKLAALDLRRMAEADRIGLVAFAGVAFLQMPMSTDPDAFRQHLESLDTTLLPQGGTALTEAIQTTMAAFKESGLDNHKALVLFTDGEDHDGEAVEAAREAAKQGLTVFTVGVGTTQGELIPLRDAKGRTDFIKDENGNAVRSRLNESLLKELSAAGKGFYLPLSTPNSMEVLYQRGLAPLPKRDFQTTLTRQYFERFQWFLGLALLLLVIERILPDRAHPKRPVTGKPVGAITAAGLAFLLLTVSTAQASPSAARNHFEAGRFKNALTEYERLLKQAPNDSPLHYNAGNAAYQAGKFDSAYEHFAAALATLDPKLQQQAYYNRGNAQYRTGEAEEAPDKTIATWKRAIEDYDTALKLDPNDSQAQKNRELVQRRLEELQKKQEQKDSQDQKDPQDKDKKEDKKDDKKEQDSKQQNKQEGKDKQDEKQKSDQKQKDSSEKKDGSEKKTDEKQGDEEKSQDQQAADKDKKPQQQEGKEGKEGSQEKGKADDKRGQQPGQEPQQAGQLMQQGETNGEPQSVQGNRVMRMTQQQAIQLLEALRSEEKMLRPTPVITNRTDRSSRKLKDW